MQIQINNTPHTTEAQTLAALAVELALPPKGVAVAVANRMVPRIEWESTPITEGTHILIIKAACGG